MLPPRLSLFGGGDSTSKKPNRNLSPPTLILRTEKEVYRPGDEVVITIEISTSNADDNNSVSSNSELDNVSVLSFLITRLSFEIKGIEKLDTQWFATPKPSPESKRRRGEYVFMDCSVASVASNQIVSPGADKTYVVRTVLPGIIPPSYRGTTIRYLYYVKSILVGRWQVLENGLSSKQPVKDSVEQEARVPLQIWVDQKNNGLALEDGQGIVPSATVQLDLYWKEMGGDSDWIRANDISDGVEEGYDSSKDEVSSVSSYNPNRASLQRTFGSSLSLQSSTARSSTRDLLYPEGERMSLSSNLAHPRVSAAEVNNEAGFGLSPRKLASPVSSSQQQKPERSLSLDKDEPAFSPVSEGFVRGRSYNIRMDDQVLLRFSPKNSDSTYYFSDMIGGTLTFFHGEGARRCLEISITLETSETIDRHSIHPSRRHSPTITKIQSDHHEVVADLVQTSFLFSIPMDGPMSFSTPHVSVRWSLRFEFYTTPKNVDWMRYDHPLLIDGRDKSEWVLPITVHAPPPGAQSTNARNEKPFSLDPLWGHN